MLPYNILSFVLSCLSITLIHAQILNRETEFPANTPTNAPPTSPSSSILVISPPTVPPTAVSTPVSTIVRNTQLPRPAPTVPASPEPPRPESKPKLPKQEERVVGPSIPEISEASAENASSSEANLEKEGLGEKEEEPLLEELLPILLFSLALGCVVQYALEVLPSYLTLPYTVVLFILGFGIGALNDVKSLKLGVFGHGIEQFRNIEPEVVLMVLLPPLLYESASVMDYHVFGKVAWSSIILAFPGVVISALLTAVFFMFVPGYGFNFSFSMMLGSILSATDPVAVVAALNSLGAPPRLNSLIDGEALLNDGSAFVMFLLFLDFAAGEQKTFLQSTISFVQLAIGGPLVGLVFALVTIAFVRRVFNDPYVEAGSLILMVYTTFFISETVLHVSSVLATVVFGLYVAYKGKYELSPEVEHHVHSVVGQIAFWSNTLIFVLAGVLSYDKFADIGFNGKHFGILAALYVALHIIRFVAIMALYPILTRIGYGLDMRDVGLLVYGGLRGAVALVLALLVDLDKRFANRRLDRALLSFHVAGIAVLTILINGSTTQWFYNKLGIDPPSPAYGTLVRSALNGLEEESRETAKKLEEDWFYKYADWKIILSIIPDFRNISIKGRQIIFDVENPDSSSTDTLKQVKTDLESLTTGPTPNFRFSALIPSHNLDNRHLSRSSLIFRGNGFDDPGRSNRRSTWFTDTTKQAAEELASITFFNALRAHYLERFECGYLTPNSLRVLKEATDRAAESITKRATPQSQILSDAIMQGWKTLESCLPNLDVTQSRASIPIIGPLIFKRLLLEQITTTTESIAGFIHAQEIVSQSLLHSLGTTHTPSYLTSVPQTISRLTSTARSRLIQIFRTYPLIVREVQTLQCVRYLLHAKRELVAEAVQEGILDSKAGSQCVTEIERRLRFLRTRDVRSKVE